jgi:hypothetical protein
MRPSRHPIVVARAEALFISSVPTGALLTRTELHNIVASAVRTRGSVRQCAAEMAALFGEWPETSASRMRWALRVVTAVHRADS